MNGSANCLAPMITFIIEPFGFNSYDSSVLGITCVLSGFLSSIVFPILIQKWQWYLKSMKIMVYGALVAQVAIMLSLVSEELNYVTMAMALFGIFNIPTICIVYTFATEVTYPVSETLFGSIYQAGSCLFSFVMSYVSLYLIDTVGATVVTIIFIAIYGISCVLVIFLKEDLRRLKLSAETKTIRDDKNEYGKELLA